VKTSVTFPSQKKDPKILRQSRDAWNFFANDIEVVKSITTRDYAKTIKG